MGPLSSTEALDETTVCYTAPTTTIWRVVEYTIINSDCIIMLFTDDFTIFFLHKLNKLCAATEFAQTTVKSKGS